MKKYFIYENKQKIYLGIICMGGGPANLEARDGLCWRLSVGPFSPFIELLLFETLAADGFFSSVPTQIIILYGKH